MDSVHKNNYSASLLSAYTVFLKGVSFGFGVDAIKNEDWKQILFHLHFALIDSLTNSDFKEDQLSFFPLDPSRDCQALPIMNNSLVSQVEKKVADLSMILTAIG